MTTYIVTGISFFLLIIALGLPKTITTIRTTQELEKLDQLHQDLTFFADAFTQYKAAHKEWPSTLLKGGELPQAWIFFWT